MLEAGSRRLAQAEPALCDRRYYATRRSPRPITRRASSPAATPAFRRFDDVHRVLDVLLRRRELQRDGQAARRRRARRAAFSCGDSDRFAGALDRLSPALNRARRCSSATRPRSRAAVAAEHRRSLRSGRSGTGTPSISRTRSAAPPSSADGRKQVRERLGPSPAAC